jgi:hypothetical protein
MIQYLFLSTCRFYQFGSKLIRPPGQFAIAEWFYSDCQKNGPVFERFFLQPYKRLYRTSVFRNFIMESGANDAYKYLPTHKHLAMESKDGKCKNSGGG